MLGNLTAEFLQDALQGRHKQTGVNMIQAWKSFKKVRYCQYVLVTLCLGCGFWFAFDALYPLCIELFQKLMTFNNTLTIEQKLLLSAVCFGFAFLWIRVMIHTKGTNSPHIQHNIGHSDGIDESECEIEYNNHVCRLNQYENVRQRGAYTQDRQVTNPITWRNEDGSVPYRQDRQILNPVIWRNEDGSVPYRQHRHTERHRNKCVLSV